MLNLTARALRGEIAAGRVTSVEATEDALGRIEKCDSTIGAFISTFGDYALAKARGVDERIAAGEAVGALAGVPVAVKDNMCMRQGATTCASKILESFHSPYNLRASRKTRRRC